MRSHVFDAPSRGKTLAHASLLTAVLLFNGCSSGSGLRNNAGGNTSPAAGGSAGNQGTTLTNGVAGASGGSPASGGSTSQATSTSTCGGTTASSGCSSVVGGASAGSTGGSTTTASGGGTGGSTRVSGSTSVGGTTTGVGGRSTSSAGGDSVTGGSSAMAGAGGASISSTGGSVLGGTNAAGGSTSTIRSPDAGIGDGGIVASGYCEGDSPKLTYQGQTVTPGVTDYVSGIVMDCCQGYGVNLHASASLGFDLALELILSIDISTPKEYAVIATSPGTRVAVRKSTDPFSYTSGATALGSLRVIAMDTSAGNWEAGLCLEVTDASSVLFGTKIYVPRVVMGSYESNKRFQLFLLGDATLRVDDLTNQPLDALVLDTNPLLDLNKIAYIENSTFKIGLDPDQGVLSSLRTKLGTPLGTPFVAVANGARIYLGTFTAGLSSISPVGPFAMVDEFTSDGFVLHAPMSGTDTRFDTRILKALSERGKLVP